MAEDSRGRESSGSTAPRRGANTLPGVLQYVAGIEGGENLLFIDLIDFLVTRYFSFSKAERRGTLG